MYFNTYNEKIIYVGKNDPYSLFSCMLAGVTYKNPNYRIVRNNCDVYVFEYVVSGKGRLKSEAGYMMFTRVCFTVSKRALMKFTTPPRMNLMKKCG